MNSSVGSSVTSCSIRLLAALCLLLPAACGDSSNPSTSLSETDRAVDEQIRVQVESALAGAADLPPGFTVAVNEGVVLISGSLACPDCGGMRTPGNTGTIQQSLGGVVRAVPGVMAVEFDLSYDTD